MILVRVVVSVHGVGVVCLTAASRCVFVVVDIQYKYMYMCKAGL
jgi:hypothetical protein